MNKFETTIWIVFIICTSIVITLIFIPQGNANAKLYDYQNYQKITEALLDSIDKVHNWSDTVGETDIYMDWLNARKKLNNNE